MSSSEIFISDAKVLEECRDAVDNAEIRQVNRLYKCVLKRRIARVGQGSCFTSGRSCVD